MNNTIEQEIKEFFSEYFEKMELRHIDEDKFVMGYEGKKLAIDFRELFKGDYEDKVLSDFCENKEIDYYFKQDDFNIGILNEKLVKFDCIGFKFEDYIELFFDYGNVSAYKEYSVDIFNIGDVKVEIGSPTELFQLVFKQLEDDKYLGDWRDNETIRLYGVNDGNYKSLVQQALFYIGYSSPSVHTNEYPRIRKFSGKYYNITGFEFDEADQLKSTFENQISTKEFPNIKYPEVISFYNAAVNIQDEEISFLYFYKVIEYFFHFNYQPQFIEKIEEYNTNHDIIQFIKDITKIYKKGEEDLLIHLLKNLECKIRRVLEYSYNQGLIDEIDIKKFAKNLYKYRNSLVHGKGDKKLELKIPDDIEETKEKFWNIITRELANTIIFEYCIDTEKRYSFT